MMRRSQQTHDSVNARPREVSSRPMADGVIMNAPVRVATIDDAPGIAKVLVDGWQSTYSGILPAAFLDSFRYETHAAGTRQHLQDLPSSVAVFVAEAENRIVGVAHVKEADTGPEGFAAELEALYVLPSVQGRHVGTRLFLRAVQWGQQQRFPSLALWVLRDNPHRGFYEHWGADLLSDERVDDFGGVQVTSVAYGWRDLDAFGQRLQSTLRRTAVRPSDSEMQSDPRLT